MLKSPKYKPPSTLTMSEQELAAEQQSKNAIKWIDGLPEKKQAKWPYNGVLGEKVKGYCCLGAGCSLLEIQYAPTDTYSLELMESVGLRGSAGSLANGNLFYGKEHLSNINDDTNAGFKRISKLMKTHPTWLFHPEVANLISLHYNKTKS